jgi:ABC-type sulfate transport system substrate-binding protein
MEHVVYLDTKAKEFARLLDGSKKMIIRGAAGRKIPYERVNSGDVLYFIENNASGLICGQGIVADVFNSGKLTEEESISLVETNQDKLQLSPQQIARWAGKRYLVLIEVKDIVKVDPFPIDKSGFSNMDDWLPVEDINKVKK